MNDQAKMSALCWMKVGDSQGLRTIWEAALYTRHTSEPLACGAVPAKRSMHVVTTWWYLRSGCQGQSPVQLSDEGQRRGAIVKCH